MVNSNWIFDRLGEPVFLAQLSGWQHAAALLFVALVSGAVAWWWQLKKMQVLEHQIQQDAQDARGQMLELERQHQGELGRNAEQLEQVLTEADEIKKRLAMHQEAALRREGELRDKSKLVEQDLAVAMEKAMQLPPVQTRRNELEALLKAERASGEVMKQNLEQMQTRTARHEAELKGLQTRLDAATARAEKLELESKSRLALQEQHVARDDGALAALRDVHASYVRATESKLANLRRQLAAAEQAGEAGQGKDTQIQELEARLDHMTSEAQAKESEHARQVAELEQSLDQVKAALAQERKNAAELVNAVTDTPTAEATAAPSNTAKSKNAERLVEEIDRLQEINNRLLADLEILRFVRKEALDPLPEVR